MYKTMLQEMCQKRRWKLPEYSAVSDETNPNARFTATVVVNGATFSSPQACRSIKDAQNLAASEAHAALTEKDQQKAGATQFPPPPHDLSLEHLGGEELGQSDDDLIPKVVQHICKNKLQQYSQKNNLALPLYKKEFDGPSHARRYRSTVSVGGKEYKSDGFFTTLKDAEQSAAQKACEDLSVDLNQEDSSLYKNLLQQLAQKRGIVLPAYETIHSGPFHNVSFTSTVEVEGRKFKGPEARNKRQAETMAAKVAYLALTKGKEIASEAKNQEEEERAVSSGGGYYYQLRGPVDAYPVEIISSGGGGGNSKTLIVRRGKNYHIPAGAVVKTCDDDWVGYKVVG